MTASTHAVEPDEMGADADNGGERASTTRQFVTFATGTEVFAAPMSMVQEIIRVPEVVRVPLAPPTLNGLANLRGRVLPIVSLRGLFGFETGRHDDATRVLVVNVGRPLGFVVDRVTSVIEVEPDRIEDVDGISSTVDTTLLSGLIKDVGGVSMTMILDFAKLTAREFAQIASATGRGSISTKDVGREASVAAQETIDELRLVSFHVAGQEYAVAIEDVQEIVQVPSVIVHVPHAESHVLGVMTLRSRLLPIVDLRRLFSLPERELSEQSRIVVLSYQGSSVGLAVDGVNEVLQVAKSNVDPLPPLLAREDDLSDIAEICRLNDGARLVSIVTVRNLFGHTSIKQALEVAEEIESQRDTEENDGTEAAAEVKSGEEDEQVVVFRLDKEEFGVPIGNVEEIVRVPDQLTRVPKAPDFVEGVINLRGTVLPVLDLRLRLGMCQITHTDHQRIMVFMISKLRTGFIVDHVAEVLKIPQASIEDAPTLSSEQGLLLSRMANLDGQKRIIQLLEPSRLVDGRELAELAAVTAEDDGD